MRPTRIRAEGFAAYRQPVDIDLDGVEFFSLSGPTGSGKSSLIDVIVFALFGRVPRLGGNSVAPAISAGMDATKVAFDFEIGDVGFTVGRRAERRNGGASVKEARLQQGETVLASGADEVTREVEQLLGLRFDDFVRTVVLPQGEFARFLSAGKAERQALLRNLLGLDIYQHVRSLAKERAAAASEREAIAIQLLDSLDLAEPEVVEADEMRLAALEELSARIVTDEKTLQQLESETFSARKMQEDTEASLERLVLIAPPDNLNDLDRLAMEARDAVGSAENSVEVTSKVIAEDEAKLAQLLSQDKVESLKADHQDLAAVRKKLAETDTASAIAAVEKAQTSLDAALLAKTKAQDAYNVSMTRHAAHAIAVSLSVGEPCPVCNQTVEEIDGKTAPSDLSEVEAELEAADSSVDVARSELSVARERLSGVEAVRSELTSQIERLESVLKTAPSLEELAEAEKQLQELTKVIDDNREMLATARRSLVTARRHEEDVADAENQVDKRLVAAQMSVAALQPPVSTSDDVIVRWKDLLEWREIKAAELGEVLEANRSAVTAAEQKSIELRKSLVAGLEALDVDPVEPYSVKVATHMEKARQVVAEHGRVAVESKRLKLEAEQARKTAAVADSLADHLKSSGFEQWLMSGALSDLVHGANGILDQLSGGGYSLNSDDSGSFAIVDHRNADELRPVSTLSGGETFLVSLALALSLAETLATAGGAQLDTIILDEGFGTLDEESLDTVASVLEELSGDGLTVGVITHVKELASRAPIRFEVSKEPDGSKVRLVS